MPGFDGTGPQGSGTMTGRGRGYCLLPLSNKTSIKEFSRDSQTSEQQISRDRGRGRCQRACWVQSSDN